MIRRKQPKPIPNPSPMSSFQRLFQAYFRPCSPALAGFFILLSGCGGNLYTTARVVPKGEVQHTFGMGMFVVNRDYTFPTAVYQARMGLHEKLDIGLQAGSTFRADAKGNIFTTDHVAASLDFSLEFNAYPDRYIIPELPLLLSFDFTRNISWVIYGGPGLVANTEQSSFIVKAGSGIQWRATDDLTVQLEGNARFLNIDKSLYPNPILAFGLGFGFGGQTRPPLGEPPKNEPPKK